MSDEALLFLALVVATLGMGGMALSISAHWRQLFDPRPLSSGMRTCLRAAGAVLLAASFLLCTAADPVMMAILVWPMLLLVGAGLVAAGFTLHAQSRRAVKIARDTGGRGKAGR